MAWVWSHPTPVWRSSAVPFVSFVTSVVKAWVYFGDLMAPPVIFLPLLQTKPLVPFDPRETLAWRLGGPWVAQG